jgi:hypothetical protein
LLLIYYISTCWLGTSIIVVVARLLWSAFVVWHFSVVAVADAFVLASVAAAFSC